MYMSCCNFLIGERGRRILSYVLLMFDVILLLTGLAALSMTLFMKVKAGGVRNTQRRSNSGYSITSERFLLVVLVVSVVIHLCGIKLWIDCTNWRVRRKRKFLIPMYAILRFLFLPMIFSAAIAAHVEGKAILKLDKYINSVHLHPKTDTVKFVEVPQVTDTTPLQGEIGDTLNTADSGGVTDSAARYDNGDIEIEVENRPLDIAATWLWKVLLLSAATEVICLMLIRILERSNWHSISWGDPTQDAHGYLCVCCGNEPVPPNPRVRPDSDSEEENEVLNKGSNSSATGLSNGSAVLKDLPNVSRMFVTTNNPPMSVPLMTASRQLQDQHRSQDQHRQLSTTTYSSTLQDQHHQPSTTTYLNTLQDQHLQSNQVQHT